MALPPLRVFKVRAFQQEVRDALKNSLPQLLMQVDEATIRKLVIAVAKQKLYSKLGTPVYEAIIGQWKHFVWEMRSCRQLKEKLSLFQQRHGHNPVQPGAPPAPSQHNTMAISSLLAPPAPADDPTRAPTLFQNMPFQWTLAPPSYWDFSPVPEPPTLLPLAPIERPRYYSA